MQRLTKRQWSFTLIYLLVAAGIFYLIQSAVAPPRPRQLSYSEFLTARAGQPSG